MSSSDYAVFRDMNRHTCIRTEVARKLTSFIEMSVVELRVRKLPHTEFEATYEALPDYDVRRAAARYLKAPDGVKPLISPEALSLLRKIAGPAYERESLANDPPSDIVPPLQPKKDVTMTDKTTPAKRPAAKKNAAPAAKKSAAKKVAVAAEEGTRGRAPNIDGAAKIKILTEKGANPKRGTAAERFALYKNGMTVDEYIAAGGKRADVNWDVAQGFISTK